MADDVRRRLANLSESAASALRGRLQAELGQDGLAIAFPSFLRALLEPAYRVRAGLVVGERDLADPHFECLVVDSRGSPALPAGPGVDLILADAVFGTVEMCDWLDAQTLRDAADRVASLKTVRRRPLFRGDELVNPYLGVLVAREGLTGDALLEVAARDNDARPFEEQLDLICVLDKGLLGHAEVDPEGAMSIELPLQASSRWRLAWTSLGEGTLLALYMALCETLAVRSLRAPRMHLILRALRSWDATALPLAHGIDRGE